LRTGGTGGKVSNTEIIPHLFIFIMLQGAWSRKHTNSLDQGIPDRVKRLKHMMQEHLTHTAPSNIDAKPPIKKRKTKE